MYSARPTEEVGFSATRIVGHSHVHHSYGAVKDVHGHVGQIPLQLSAASLMNRWRMLYGSVDMSQGEVDLHKIIYLSTETDVLMSYCYLYWPDGRQTL